MDSERSVQESTEWRFLRFFFLTPLACALGESAPPLKKQGSAASLRQHASGW